MSKEGSRASWNFSYEKALVDILHDHNNPKFRGQNGWVSEGWRSIVSKFNEKFSTIHFTKQQIQEKEKELKGNYKAIRDARKHSGTGWNDSLCMIVAEPSIWDKIIRDHPKVKKFRNKPFLLFNYLAALYEGSTATGDLNFVSTEQMGPPIDEVIPDENGTHDVGLNPFAANMEGQETSSAHMVADEMERDASASSTPKGNGNGKKRKQNQIAGVLESYLEFKKQQTNKFVEELNETRSQSQNDEFSIGKCVAALESIEDLTDMEKAKALRLFKCELNREIFINTKNPSVRLFWIKSEISP